MNAWRGFLLLLGLALPRWAASAEETCAALTAVPEAVQVAWISPVNRQVGANTYLEVVRVADLRAFLKAEGPSSVRLLQGLGLANAKGKGRAVKRSWKVTIFDVRSAWLCRPLAGGTADKVVEGVAVCPPSEQDGPARGFTGCGYTRDTATGGRGLDVYRVRWRDASSGGFCVLPLDRFLKGA